MSRYGCLLLAALLSVTIPTPSKSHPSGESSRDQYRARELQNGPQPLDSLIIAATDSLQKRDIIADTKKRSTSEQEGQDQQSSLMLQRLRNRRSYYPWGNGNSVQVPQFQSLGMWTPRVYPLQRPYYIPVFGVDGRIPLYLPPQPLPVNFQPKRLGGGKPVYHGPAYLPPKETPTKTPGDVENRFNFPDDDEPYDDGDDTGAGGFQSGNDDNMNVKPTRKPNVQNAMPPLVHASGPNQTANINDNNSPIDNINQLSSNLIPPKKETPPRKETPVVPPPRKEGTTSPPVKNDNKVSAPAASLGGQGISLTESGPSPCTWAIISCCSATSSRVNYQCFEQMGCYGAFWDSSPCDTDFAKAAIDTALKYYSQAEGKK